MVVGIEPLNSQSPVPSVALPRIMPPSANAFTRQGQALREAHPLLEGSGSTGPELASYVLVFLTPPGPL